MKRNCWMNKLNPQAIFNFKLPKYIHYTFGFDNNNFWTEKHFLACMFTLYYNTDVISKRNIVSEQILTVIWKLESWGIYSVSNCRDNQILNRFVKVHICFLKINPVDYYCLTHSILFIKYGGYFCFSPCEGQESFIKSRESNKLIIYHFPKLMNYLTLPRLNICLEMKHRNYWTTWHILV